MLVQSRSQSALTLASDWFDILFDSARVMMHAVDKDFQIVKVNRRWLETLGYKKNKVLGRKVTDLLTEESSIRAVKDVLPLFQQAGSDRSIGMQFVRKDGKALDILLDADVSPAASCGCFAYATLRDSHDIDQSEEASNILRALKDITTVMHSLERINVAQEGDDPAAASLAVGQVPGQVQAGVPGEATGAFLELAQDISTNLRGLLRVHEEWLSESMEQQRELILMARSLDRTLAELEDTLSAVRLRPE